MLWGSGSYISGSGRVHWRVLALVVLRSHFLLIIIIIIIIIIGVRLSPLGTAATTGLLYQS
jgi:hypothetical protein